MAMTALTLCIMAQEITVSRDVRYREGESNSWVLDIARPQAATQGLRPAIVIIHGGGWNAGSKNDPVYQNLMQHYAKQGYVALSVGYRLTREAPMPACIEDVKCAVRWLKAHAADYGVDPNRIGCYGHSAGGHLSLMLGVSSGNKDLEGDGPWKEQTSAVTCACGGAPPTEIGNAGNPWSQHPEWWPIGYEDAVTPPLLLLQGAQDPIVRPNLTEAYVNNCRKAGNKKIEFIKIAGQHGVAFDQGLDITLPAMDAFFARNLKLENADTQFTRMKVVDGCGQGPCRAVAVEERSLPGYVVYRPIDLKKSATEKGLLPVIAFANGGCNDTSITHERVLSELASHGYIIIAIGEMQWDLQDRRINHTPDGALLTKAIDWVLAQNADPKSPYYQTVDTKHIGLSGQSCGGAQVLTVAKDPRVSTYIMFNTGMGTMSMAGASKQQLNDLHGPVIYIVGDKPDVAYANAVVDYDNIKKTPVAFANLLNGGHMGTFAQPFGGTFAQVALKWMEWQMRGKTENAAFFTQFTPDKMEGWEIKAKNFK